MAKVVFSSWKGKIIDARNKDLTERPDLQKLKLPEQVLGAALKAFVGWDGLVVADPQVDVVELLRNYFREVQRESCGRCIPCRVGSKAAADLLDRLFRGEGRPGDLERLAGLGRLMRHTSLCELGQSAPVPLLHALEYFREDFAGPAGGGERAVSAGGPLRYRTVLTAPCRNGCPAHIDIPGYIRAIKEGCFEESLALIRDKTPLVGVLGRVCVHPCEANCRRQPVDEALSIRVLKRFVADFGRRKKEGDPVTGAATPGGAPGVAVIGAGPAGLNAAYMLARKGYRVTVFEALPVAGGMLAVGIPSYRLPREILQEEIALVKSLGVEIRLNTRIGRDLTLEDLRRDYDAVFIACGLHLSSAMGVEGEDAGYKGFMPGVEYLRRINLGLPVEPGKRVAVIGGGNVAMDCARSSLRLGVKEVYLVYRRSRKEMPANEAEIIAAEEEGVRFVLLANPTRILAEKGRVTGMECIRMKLGEPDSSGRRRPVPVEGSQFILEVDTIVPAIGQVADFSFLPPDSGVELTRWNTIAADPETMATAVPGVFAGGDAVLGARTVIEAIASANRAAEAIDHYLRQGRPSVTGPTALERFIEETGVYDPAEKPALVGGRQRQKEEHLPVAERVQGFCEAELGFKGPREALREAARCACCLRLGLVAY